MIKPLACDHEKMKVGVGFVTGRRSFRKVLKTYVYRWKEATSEIKKQVNLHLFVAYDLDYLNTQVEDYVNIRPDILRHLNGVSFLGQSTIDRECRELVKAGVLTEAQADGLFGRGYAGKRNSVLYFALKQGMDRLIFLDDDEYPLAVTQTRQSALWSGQNVVTQHLKYLKNADMTNGFHCGYISPIPYMQWNEALSEADFKMFIEAISNDILGWESIRQIMQNGGVTYADPQVFINNTAFDVPERNNARFISGSNLGINLQNADKIKPFYNPPGARGEDTFLSACLREHKLLRIPVYTFHDGFSAYGHLLDGVLPSTLNRIHAANDRVTMRFYRACLGWIRYKPLYLYITQRSRFEEEVASIRAKLAETIPKLNAYFKNQNFSRISSEFNRYTKQVPVHYQSFLENQHLFEKCKAHALESAAKA